MGVVQVPQEMGCTQEQIWNTYKQNMQIKPKSHIQQTEETTETKGDNRCT